MQRIYLAKYSLGCLGIAALIGCAVGTDPEAAVSELASLPVEAGQEETGPVLPPSTHSGQDEEDAGAGDDTDGGGGGDSGTDAAAGTDAGADAGGGGGVSCASPNVCAAAVDLGTVSGDTGTDFKTAQGTGSQWFKIRVSENDSGVFGVSMTVTAELQSPTGTNFDVFVYVAGGTSGQECSAVSSSSTNPTTFDSAQSGWGEGGAFSNGSDDDRTVTVEVRWVSGTCSPTSKWTLTVRGDT